MKKITFAAAPATFIALMLTAVLLAAATMALGLLGGWIGRLVVSWYAGLSVAYRVLTIMTKELANGEEEKDEE